MMHYNLIFAIYLNISYYSNNLGTCIENDDVLKAKTAPGNLTGRCFCKITGDAGCFCPAHIL